MFDNQPFQETSPGRYRIDLSGQERRLIHDLPAELVKQLESGDDDGSIYRLFPPGYTDDLGRQVEFDRLMRDDLQESHVASLRVLQDSADAKELGTTEMGAWMRAINQLRLVLGTRLDITEEIGDEELPPDDPRSGAIALYLYLSRLQEAIIEALGEPIPDEPGPDDPNLIL